jgi:hypothetical protein
MAGRLWDKGQRGRRQALGDSWGWCLDQGGDSGWCQDGAVVGQRLMVQNKKMGQLWETQGPENAQGVGGGS